MSRPIIPILFSYLLGLISGYHLNIPFHIVIVSLFITISLTALSLLIRKASLPFFIFSLLTLFIIGIARMGAILNPLFPENHITNLISEEPMSLEGRICEYPGRGLDKTRLHIDLSYLYFGDTPYPVSGKIFLTVGERELGLKYGDTIRLLAKIKKPRNFHNPGGFDYERYLALRGIFATAYLKEGEGIVKIGKKAPSIIGWIDEMREAIRGSVFNNAGASAPILLALITGEQGEIPRETREAFSKAGTAHILAISGEHIGMITLASFALFIRLLKLSERVMLTINIYKVAAVMAIPAVVLYTLIAGGGFSIVRAAIMGGILLVAVLADRRRDIPVLIAVAAFLILAFEPQALFDISFQLSFASVISIAMIFPYLKRLHLSKRKAMDLQRPRLITHVFSWLKILLFVTLAAAVGTAPLVAHYFNRLSIISPLSNLLIVPVVGFIIVPLGLMASILIPFSETISGWLFTANSQLISVVIKLTDFIASIPVTSIRIVTPNLLEMALFYLFLTLLIYRKELKWGRRLIILLITIIVSLQSFYLMRPWFGKDLNATFMDVGQGESALVEFPGGKRMLIDGGGMSAGDFDIGERVIAPFLWQRKISRIDYVVLSHPNSDHYSGLPFILRNFKVNEVWESGLEEDSEGYREFKKAADEWGLRGIKVSDGDIFNIGSATVEVVNPPKDYVADDDRAANNGSIVMRIKYGDASFLFTGDVEKEAETRLLSKGEILKSTVLKVPHHGSLTSSTVAFLDKVRPEKAIFSVGYKNSFGFPKEEVVKRYRDINTRIFRTDRDGALVMTTDGISVRFFINLNMPHYFQ